VPTRLMPVVVTIRIAEHTHQTIRRHLLFRITIQLVVMLAVIRRLLQVVQRFRDILLTTCHLHRLQGFHRPMAHRLDEEDTHHMIVIISNMVENDDDLEVTELKRIFSSNIERTKKTFWG